MKRKLALIIPIIIVLQSCLGKKTDESRDERFHGTFQEEFNDSVSSYFSHGTGGKGADFTWKMGVDSPTESGTKILSFKIDPDDVAGAGRGPEIISNDFTFYGTYAARLKVPDVRDIQPNVGAVVGYFTYRIDSIYGQSEIDYEWLIADPEIIYIGTWTGSRENSKRIGRTINMAKGIIHDTSYRERTSGVSSPLTGEQNYPETLFPIEGYDASSRFYTYGFDWYPDRIRWWMIHPVTSDTVVLWDYRASQIGMPETHTRYRMNFWHTNNWPVVGNPNSIEKPISPFELEVDWMSYKPIDVIRKDKK
jgi:beta-glucanase (GH16 family)